MLALAVLAPIAAAWHASLLPSTYDMAATGTPDSAAVPRRRPGPAASPTLTGAGHRPPDVAVTLTARPGGTRYTLERHARPARRSAPVEGQLVQVQLVNESVPDGVTLHWHGLDVPNAEDGVAGVTQDAVPVGGEHVYRFVADRRRHVLVPLAPGLARAGAARPVRAARGRPARPAPAVTAEARRSCTSTTASTRSTASRQSTPSPPRPARPCGCACSTPTTAPTAVWIAGAPFAVVAVDGTDVHAPAPVRDTAVLVTAGGRADLQLTVPPGGIRLETGTAALVIGPAGSAPAAAPRPAGVVDMLTYGSPAPLPFDPARPDRRFGYAIGRAPGFLDGVPGSGGRSTGTSTRTTRCSSSTQGDVVVMHVSNDSGEAHPMHLHGHHGVVLARNGVAATGSPWWFDSLEIADGDSYDVAFRADNPGVWMDHCHNLQHARDGLVAHLMYAGVTTPYRIGDRGNQPE